MKNVALASLVIVCIGILTAVPASVSYAGSIDTAKNESVAEVTTNIINLNTASKEELVQISGIGPILADRILAYRSENGPFANLEDVMLVKGVGEAKFKKIESMITI
jgi:competence protein ComEA